MVLPSLAKQIGLNQALFVQQLFFLLSMSKGGVYANGCKWIYNTVSDWAEIFPFWSERTIQRLIKELQDSLIVDVIDDPDGGPKRLFRLNEGMLEKLSRGDIEGNPSLETLKRATDCHPPTRQVVTGGHDKLSPPLTIYTETTTENTPERVLPSEAKPSSEHKQFIQDWVEAYKAHWKFGYVFAGAKDGTAVKTLLKAMPSSEALRVARAAWAHGGFWCKQAATIAGFASKLNEIRAELALPVAAPKPADNDPFRNM